MTIENSPRCGRAPPRLVAGRGGRRRGAWSRGDARHELGGDCNRCEHEHGIATLIRSEGRS